MMDHDEKLKTHSKLENDLPSPRERKNPMSTELNLPHAVAALIAAQNNYDSTVFSEQFTIDATVYDEGQFYNGRPAIKQWNQMTNDKYSVTLMPVAFMNEDAHSILTVQVSGNFPGSPIDLKYQFTFERDQIKTLKISS